MVETGILERLGLREKSRTEVRPSAADAEFLSDEDIKDIAVALALRRVALRDALRHLDRAFAVRESSVEAQYETEVAMTIATLQQIRDGIAREEVMLNENDAEARRYREEQSLLSEELKRLRFNVYTNVQEIKKKRLTHERQMFEAEGSRLKHEASAKYDEALRDLDAQIEIAKKLYDLEKERWDINQGEYARRVGELTKEKERVEEELNDLRLNLKQLKKVGITRHTAGFLIWAGYAALAGVGGVIANLLSSKPLGAVDYISLLFQYLTNIVRTLQTTRTPSDFWYLILWPSIVVLSILGMTSGLIWVADYVLRKFVRRRFVNWGLEPGVGKKSRRKGKGMRAVAEGDRLSEQLPFLTPEINRMSLPLPDIDRRSYIKLLALLPYLFLAFVIVLLSIGGAATPPSGEAASATTATAMSMTYVGIVFALLTVSVFVLYATNVIEPRWRRLAEAVGTRPAPAVTVGTESGAPAHPPEPGLPMYLRTHWEFLVIICAMLLAILVVVCLPAQDYRTHAVWSAVAIFMCFSSMAFAYGIIQRGLFRSEDYLDSRRALYRNLIEKYSTEPTIIDIFEAVNAEEIKGFIDTHRRARQDLDELRLLYELKRHFADHYLDDGELLKQWSNLKKWAEPFGFNGKLTLRRTEPTELDWLDYEAAPDEARAVNQAKDEQIHINSRLEGLAAEAARAEQTRAKIKSKLVELESEMKAQERIKVELEQSREQEQANLRVKREADHLTFMSAYSLGLDLADLTDD